MTSRLLLLSLILAGGARPCSAQADDARDKDAFFEQHIRPVLESKCIKCHGPRKQESGLRLDSRELILRGGETGAAVVPGQPDDSLLMEAVRYDGLEMPPNEQLPDRTVARFEKWIRDGAVWPRGSNLREHGNAITKEDRNWWAFRPLGQDPPPNVADPWCRNEIDQFLLARMREQGLRPAPMADRDQLVRRVYFDLIGLPPTPEQVSEFVSDDSPDAWERLVDRLLASERYGEHWGRHWLDVVRYAESDGWNQDAYRRNIWRYRDYVVKAFNDDKPWPKFVRQQLAGDEMPGDDPQNLAATGFLRLGIYEYNQRDARGQWNDIMNELTDVVGDVFLGVGMACARCHDHKFDPLLQRDYFRLRAFFEPIEWRDDLVYATNQEQEAHHQKMEQWRNRAKDQLAGIDRILKPYHDRKWKSTVEKFPVEIQTCFTTPVSDRTSWQHQMAYLVARQFEEEAGGPLKSMKKEDKARYDELRKQADALNKPAPLPKLMAATDFRGTPSPTVIQDSDTEVAPGFLTVLSKDGSPARLPVVDGSSGRRTALAEWIGRPENALTNRVIVNRIWQYHFGRGLVDSPNDFGRQGTPPAHPRLLDWLATTFVQDGWSMKRMHKRILMSAAWRQSATHPDARRQQEHDPGEGLFWRARVRRIGAEGIRDAMLAVSGELVHRLGGPAVDLKSPRRSLYLKSLRNTPNEFLQQFDMANGLKSVAMRNSTTTPTQALMMINGAYPLARAAAFAKRLVKADADTSADMVANAFRLAYGREPTQDEARAAADYLQVSPSEPPDKVSVDRLTDLCHVLFNSNEFLYVD